MRCARPPTLASSKKPRPGAAHSPTNRHAPRPALTANGGVPKAAQAPQAPAKSKGGMRKALLTGGAVGGVGALVTGVLFAAGVLKLGSRADTPPAQIALNTKPNDPVASLPEQDKPAAIQSEPGRAARDVAPPPMSGEATDPEPRPSHPAPVKLPEIGKLIPPSPKPQEKAPQPAPVEAPKAEDPPPPPKSPEKRPPVTESGRPLKSDAPRPPATEPARPAPEPMKSRDPESEVPAKVVKALPATASNLAVGGGGRYLVLHLAAQKKLAVFDLSEARIVRYIPLSADEVKFTAGQDKVVVVLPETSVIQRWDLATGERELAVPLAARGKVAAVCMGSASQGPVFVGIGNTIETPFQFLDLRTFKPLALKMPEHRPLFPGPCVRASADGRTFGLAFPRGGGGVQSLVVAGGEVQFHDNGGDPCGHVVPSPDGKVLYTSRGAFSDQAKRGADARDDLYSLPATQPGLYLAFRLHDFFNRRGNEKVVPSVYLAATDQPLVTLPEVELPVGLNPWDRDAFTLARHILLNPEARRLVVIPETNDRVVLYRFDLAEVLAKSEADYLLVTSRPPTAAAKGSAYTYKLEVKSKKGGVKYRLDSGPPGMEVSADGLVKWKVPAGFADAETEVIVNVSDASGQEWFQTFTVHVRGD
jgi:hypothetical protein